MSKWIYGSISLIYSLCLINRWANGDGVGILIFAFAATICAVLAYFEWRK